MSIEARRRAFYNHKGIVIPRNSRTISTPLDGSSAKVLSDLIPTSCITETYPVIGTTTYGDIRPLNEQDETFDTYVLRRMQAQPGSDFTRVFFTKVFSAAELATPYKTLRKVDDFYWPPILYGVKFLPDFSYPLFTQRADGKFVYAPRYYSRIDYVDAQTKGTLFIYEYFVGHSAFTIPHHESPMPTTVKYSFANIDETFQACLHKKLVLEAMRTAYGAFDAVRGSTFPANGSVAGQIFPATNHVTWEAHVTNDSNIEAELLFQRVKVSVYPPTPPEPSRG